MNFTNLDAASQRIYDYLAHNLSQSMLSAQNSQCLMMVIIYTYVYVKMNKDAQRCKTVPLCTFLAGSRGSVKGDLVGDDLHGTRLV